MPIQKKKAIIIWQNGEWDWMVRADGGRELGHYSTRIEAEAIGRKLAHKRGVDLVVQDPSGEAPPKRRSWLSRLLRR